MSVSFVRRNKRERESEREKQFSSFMLLKGGKKSDSLIILDKFETIKKKIPVLMSSEVDDLEVWLNFWSVINHLLICD